MRRRRVVCHILLLALVVAGTSSCHITFGGRGTLNCVTDRSLDRAVVQMSDASPRGD